VQTPADRRWRAAQISETAGGTKYAARSSRTAKVRSRDRLAILGGERPLVATSAGIMVKASSKFAASTARPWRARGEGSWDLTAAAMIKADLVTFRISCPTYHRTLKSSRLVV
jgi:hypothetical protein